MGDKLVDRVYLEGQKNPVPLREGSSALYMLALARDEAHRSSNLAREKLGKRRRMRSGLEDVRGIGEKTRKSLLRKLGSLKAIVAATAEELVAGGASRAQAKAIRAHFGDPGVAAAIEAQSIESAAGAIVAEGAVGETLDVAAQAPAELEAHADEATPLVTPVDETVEVEEDAIDHAFVGGET